MRLFHSLPNKGRRPEPVSRIFKAILVLIIILNPLISPGQVEYDPRLEEAGLTFKEGFAQYNEGKFEEAIETFRETLALSPGFERAWYYLGGAYYRLGLLDEAVYAWEEFMRLAGEDRELRRRINNIYHLSRPQGLETLTSYQHLTAFMGNRWDEAGFHNPTGLVLDSEGNLYLVSFSSHRIVKLSPTGLPLLELGGVGEGQGRFLNPFGIALDSEGNIYVTDFGNHRVQKFDPKGNFLLSFGQPGQGDGEFLGPEGITVDQDGNIYVVDNGNARIEKFDPGGKFLLQMGKFGRRPGELDRPVGVGLDAEGDIWVSDAGNHRVVEFDSSGNFLRLFPLPPGLLEPRGLVFETSGYLYLAAASGVVLRLDLADFNWNCLKTWNGKKGRFSTPSDVALDRYGALWVVDYERHRADSFMPSHFKLAGLNILTNQVILDHFPKVVYSVTVATDDGRPVMGLTENNFKIVEDGVRFLLFGFSDLYQEKSDRLLIILVLDVRLRMEEHRDKLNEVFKQLINSLKPGTSIEIITFADKVDLIQPRTPNRDLLWDKIVTRESVIQEDRDVLWKALHTAVKETVNLPTRKLILLFSEQEEPARQSYLYDEAINYAKINQCPVYSIDFTIGQNSDLLKRIAKETNGEYISVYRDGKQTANLYQEIESKLKGQGQYVLSYESPVKKWTGSWIDATISVGYFDLYAEDKRGYFVPPSQTKAPH
ncbi:MAG: 6-bladed beta-propeller [bacterium]